MNEKSHKIQKTFNKFWFELELPKKNYDGHEIAKKACILLNKMGIDYTNPVWWNSKKHCYCFTIDSAGSYVEAGDNGNWYNLDYLTKDD